MSRSPSLLLLMLAGGLFCCSACSSRSDSDYSTPGEGTATSDQPSPQATRIATAPPDPADAVRHALAVGDVDGAERLFLELDIAVQQAHVMLRTELALELTRLGHSAMSTRALAEAVGYLDRALTLDPRLAPAHLLRCLAFLQSDENERALLDCDRAIELDPSNPLTHGYRSGALVNLGRASESLESADRAIGAGLEQGWIYSNRGGALTHLGRYDEAMESLNRAILLDPTFALAYSNRGWLYTLLKEYDLARTDIEHALHLDPNLEAAHQSMRVLEWALVNVPVTD